MSHRTINFTFDRRAWWSHLPAPPPPLYLQACHRHPSSACGWIYIDQPCCCVCVNKRHHFVVSWLLHFYSNYALPHHPNISIIRVFARNGFNISDVMMSISGGIPISRPLLIFLLFCWWWRATRRYTHSGGPQEWVESSEEKFDGKYIPTNHSHQLLR